MQVKIYSKSGCSYCKKAKEWFQTNRIPYEETVLDDYQERQEFYQRVSNGVQVTSVPQIFIDDKHVNIKDCFFYITYPIIHPSILHFATYSLIK